MNSDKKAAQQDNCRHSSIETYMGKTYCVFCELEFEREDSTAISSNVESDRPSTKDKRRGDDD